MARSRKVSNKTSAKVWQYRKGEPPHTVTAYERVKRNRVIEVRWWVGSLKSFRTRSLGFGIRDERGVIVEELEQEAVRRTQASPATSRPRNGLPSTGRWQVSQAP